MKSTAKSGSLQPVINENLQKVRDKINAACNRARRDPNDIKLIAVTKTHPASTIQKAVDAGLKDLGENRVQELISKMDEVTDNPNWHLIGHLQSNKVRKIAGKVTMIHSVDSLHLAEEIDRVSEKLGIASNVLVQVNTSFEESKFGCEPGKATGLLKKLSKLKSIKVKGLMTIGNFAEDPEDVRPCFKLLHEVFQKAKSENIDNVEMKELSMGMTNDFETAIEEGATMIRVGTALFGSR